MGLLDVPRGLISRLPLVGGSSEPDERGPDEVEEPGKADPPPEKVSNEAPEEPDGPDPEPEDEPDSESDSDDEPGSDDSSGKEDISGTTAPSIGPETVIEKEDPEERLARHEQSDTDAMGLDKRREVIGTAGGPSAGKQIVRWLVVACVVAAAAFGAKLLVDDLDKPPENNPAKAPWAGSEQAPKPLE
jgi:hypothetical protein